MRKPGAKRRVLSVVIAIAAVVAAGWWWRAHRGTEPVTSTLVQPQHGGATATATSATHAPAPARLTVTVTDEHGPLVDATLRLDPADGEIIVVHSGSDGIAHADQLAPGTWRISASADGHAPAALPTQRLTPGATVSLAVRLTSGGRVLSGVVSDATGGVIAGARIDAARLTAQASPGEAVSTAITGTDGKYRLTVAEGTLLVAASSADYAPQSRYVEIGPAGATADFALVPGGVIEGIVRDQRSHEPVAGAAVTARRDSPAMVFAEATTHRATAGSDGRFRLTGLRPGAWELAATADARHTKTQTVVGVGVAEQVSNVELVIGDGPVIRGRAIDDTGAPAPSVSVRAHTRGNATEVAADATGAFVVEGLAPGTYALTASGASYLPAAGTSVELTDRDVDNVVVKVSRGLTLHGHVEPRQPCDVHVEADEPRGGMVPAVAPAEATDPDGNFALGPVADGPVRLAARCTSGDQGSAPFDRPGTADLIVHVAPGASIAGRVLDADGKPLAATGVMASDISVTDRTSIVNGVVTSGVHALTDASGAYQIDGLAAGTYRVTALDRGKPLHMHAPPPTVALAANEHKTGVDLAVDRPTGTIAGTITGPDGTPVADAWVSAQPDLFAMMLGPRDGGGGPGPGSTRTINMQDDGSGADNTAPPALTDAQGHYELHGLIRTPYNVVAEAGHGQLRARAENITPDATVDLRVVGVTSLSGTVTGPAGSAALFTVELVGPTRAQRSFTGGTYSFDRVDPGNYTVHVEAADGNAQGTVTVSPDQPATLDLVLVANAAVVGKLVDPSGAPLAGQAVVLAPDAGDGRVSIRLEGPPVTTAADGSFRLSHSAEPVIFVVMAKPPQSFMKRLTLQAGATVDLGTIKLGAPRGGSAAPPGPGGAAQPNTTPRIQRRGPAHPTPAAPVAAL